MRNWVAFLLAFDGTTTHSRPVIVLFRFTEVIRTGNDSNPATDKVGQYAEWRTLDPV